MTKYILVGGYLHKSEDKGKAFIEELVKGFDKKPVKILDCMFARSRDSWEAKMIEDQELFFKYIKDFELILALPEKFTEQVKEADVIFLRGGHTQALFDLLNADTSWIKELDGKVLAGTSAGAEVIAKYYCVVKTMRVGDGFNLVPVKFIPHWKSDYEGIIDWDGAEQKLKDYKEELPMLKLHEGEFKVFEI